MSRISVILAAAGRGVRLKKNLPKAFLKIKDKNLIEHSLDVLLSVKNIHQIIITLPNNWQDFDANIATVDTRISIIHGGNTRYESVKKAIKLLNKDTQYVLIHDVARCFTPIDIYNKIIKELHKGFNAVVPVLPIVDTVKKITNSTISKDINRDGLFIVQTPQGFTYNSITNAYSFNKEYKNNFTDESTLIRSSGVDVKVIPGHYKSFKITNPIDIRFAETLQEGEL